MTIPTRLAPIAAEHQVAYEDLCRLLGRHKEKVTPMELLAIAGNMIGKLIALQDPSVMNADMAMQIVMVNLEAGNKEALAASLAQQGHA